MSRREPAKLRRGTPPISLRAALLVLLLWSLPSARSLAQPAPDFTLESGQSLVALSHQQWVYLDFWASWCGPCRYSFPFMNTLQAELGPQGLAIIAVNVDVEPADALPFLEKYPAQFPIHYDPDGKIAEAYAVPGMPTSYLIHQGQIIERHIGFRASQAEELKAAIAQHLLKDE
ncbi:TlpA disulfide reductase family protein [Ferrimonas gelatinilytica]|uniref:Thioredoxin domain-containing protein n=1 Tax=Ferrimonas gelatinilytica TaxID=1255257 RepID=A0ABP9RWP0_9GAMM